MTEYDVKKHDAIQTVKTLMTGDLLPFLIDELKRDIALSIIRTEFEQNAKREELYMLTKAIDALDVKLQEYVNQYDQIQESE